MAQIQLRRGTTAEWGAADPTLAAAEIGVDLTTGGFKIGDGVTAWTSLAFFGVEGDAVTLAGAHDYLTISGQEITLGAIDLASDVTGNLAWSSLSATPTTLAGYGITDAVADGADAADLGSGSATDGYVLTADGAGGCAWELPSAGTGHDAVSLAGTLDYLTLDGQEITLGAIDLSADVTGQLPATSISGLSAAVAAVAPVQSVAGRTGNIVLTQTDVANTVPTTRQVIAGNGLTGGGSLLSDRTINVGAGTGITVSADAIAVDPSAIDAADLGSGAATAGYGLIADGAGGAAWTAISGGGSGLTWVSPPATPTSTGLQNQAADDGTYIYLCVAANQWIRWAPERSW